jgi:hypothetical protein
LPATLSTWGGSTPNLSAGFISNPSSQRSLIDEARIQTIVFDILALPTVPNTRELLIEWIRRTRKRRLVDATGWWVAMDEEQSGVDFVDAALNLIESGCMDKHHFHLVSVFEQVRQAFLLPERSDRVARRIEAIRQAALVSQEENNRWRRKKAAPVKAVPIEQPVVVQEPVKSTGFVIMRPMAIRSGTALQLVTDMPPPLPLGAALPPLTESLPVQSSEHGSETSPSPSVNREASDPDQPGNDESEPSTAVQDMFVVRDLASEFKSGAALPSPLEMPQQTTRHRKGMSKMSVFSSETALEMASIFATRDSASRTSHRSLTSPEPETEPIPKLSTLAEESPRLMSETDPIDSLMTHSPARSRLQSVPLSDEVLSDGETVARESFDADVDEGEISPFPKATSPPRPIPDRSTSLQQNMPSTSTQPNSPSTPALGSILKRTPAATPDPSRFVLTMPSTLSQVLNLFEPGTSNLAAGLSPGMLEIELLRIIESERQKVSLQGQAWSRQDTVRVGWLLEEIRSTVSRGDPERYIFLARN